MKKHLKSLSMVAGAVMFLASGAAQAEGQYGYDAVGGAAAVTATAKLGVTVVVPKLLLLRVGSAGATVDMATLTAAFSGGIPGGAAPVDGVNQVTGWDGTAPVFGTASSSAVRAYAWTNASGGGSITPAVTTDFTGGDATLKNKVAVASSNSVGGGLIHPAFMSGVTAISFARSALAASDWTFSISAANLLTINPGTFVGELTYTATTL